jgi:hypothetical protein
MSRDFDSKNLYDFLYNRIYYRAKWGTEAYPENGGLGPNMIKDTNFLERVHYGVIDDQNNSVIPNEDYMVQTQHGRVFDFVADAYSVMRLNFTTAIQKGLVNVDGSLISNLRMVDSYKNPRLKYGEYLGNILRFYNNTHIPNIVGITSIASYEDYVNNFFDFLFKETSDFAITMTRWMTSTDSRILDTGLAFSYSNIPYDADQQKIDQIIDHPTFDYFKNLSMNMGFSILHNNPNILLFDVSSPATRSIRRSYGLYNLNRLFNSRYIKTYTLDIEILFNTINIYYNKYAQKNSQTKVVSVQCGKTVSEYIRLSTVAYNKRIYSDLYELELYIKIRNLEEGSPFSEAKLKDIYKKSKYFMKKVDKLEAIGYTNRVFRDQVWNKDYGYDDAKAKFEGKTKTQSQRKQFGTGTQGGGGSSY